MEIPFLDLKAQYASIKDEIDAAVARVIDRSAFAGGPFVESFEQTFAQFCGVRHAIGVGSGTEAIWLSLVALGIGRGDEVITVPNSFIATAEAISFSGATPVFVDVDPHTANMDVSALKAAITPKTRAIVPVHLYGQMADMYPIMEIAERYGLQVVEDACQAHGAEYHGHKAGSMGAAGCFSFYPGKNLGAYGDAGAVVTQNDELARMVRSLRDHGQKVRYHHQVIGWNARMDGIQGAILEVKLRHLPAWNDARRRHAAYYTRELQRITGITLPIEAPNGHHVYHIYAISSCVRDALQRQLDQRGVHCGIHYPVPIHRQPAYRMLGLPQGSFPHAEALADMQLSLPMYPELSDSQLTYVVKSLAEAMYTVGSGPEAVTVPIAEAV